MMRALVMLSVTALSGCAAIQDFCYHHSKRAVARQAWKAARLSGEPASRDYADGWKLAYYDVATGSDGTPPAVAPEKYWSTKYQSFAGQAAVAAFYAGYLDGALAAEADAAGSWNRVPTSGLAVVGSELPIGEAVPGPNLEEIELEEILPVPGDAFESAVLDPPDRVAAHSPEREATTTTTATTTTKELEANEAMDRFANGDAEPFRHGFASLPISRPQLAPSANAPAAAVAQPPAAQLNIEMPRQEVAAGKDHPLRQIELGVSPASVDPLDIPAAINRPLAALEPANLAPRVHFARPADPVHSSNQKPRPSEINEPARPVPSPASPPAAEDSKTRPKPSEMDNRGKQRRSGSRDKQQATPQAKLRKTEVARQRKSAGDGSAENADKDRPPQKKSLEQWLDTYFPNAGFPTSRPRPNSKDGDATARNATSREEKQG